MKNYKDSVSDAIKVLLGVNIDAVVKCFLKTRESFSTNIFSHLTRPYSPK